MSPSEKKEALKVLSNAQALLAGITEKFNRVDQSYRALDTQHTNLETIHIPLTTRTKAILTVTVVTEGLGAIDRETLSRPTLSEFHQITDQLYQRKYEIKTA